VAGSGPALWPLVAVLALGVVGTGLAFVLQYDVVREVGPTIGATVTYVIPVVAVVLGVVFLHERLHWPQAAGAAVVLAAAVVIGRPRRRPRTEPEAAADDDLTSSVPSPTSTRRS
jgi:drug/metabolite transporter (DMT)-like permease